MSFNLLEFYLYQAYRDYYVSFFRIRGRALISLHFLEGGFSFDLLFFQFEIKEPQV